MKSTVKKRSDAVKKMRQACDSLNAETVFKAFRVYGRDLGDNMYYLTLSYMWRMFFHISEYQIELRDWLLARDPGFRTKHEFRSAFMVPDEVKVMDRLKLYNRPVSVYTAFSKTQYDRRQVWFFNPNELAGRTAHLDDLYIVQQSIPPGIIFAALVIHGVECAVILDEKFHEECEKNWNSDNQSTLLQ